MLKLNLARITWAFGLTMIFCSYNLAYADASVPKNNRSLYVRERTAKLNDDSVPLTTTSDKSTTTSLSKEKRATEAKSPSSGAASCSCSCTTRTGRSPATPGPWWDCVKGCLKSWGVSPVGLILCAGVCAFGGIPLCAICIGVDATVMMLCSIGCATYAGGIDLPVDPDHVPILVRKIPRSSGRKAAHRSLAVAVQR